MDRTAGLRGGPKIKGKFTTTKCLAEGCTDSYWANNLCRRHYLKNYFRNQPNNTLDRGKKWVRRNDLAYEVSLLTGIPFQQSRRIVRHIFNIITKAVQEGKEVSIPGFGYFGRQSFSVNQFKPPVYFVPAKELNLLINKYYEGPQ